MEVVVLEVDQENRKLSLGHKQLEENPWDVFETIFGIGSVHQGTVVSADNNGATVGLPYGVEGFCPAKQLRKEDGSKAATEETLDFVVSDFNKEARKIVVSHTRTFDKKAVDDTPKASKGGNAGSSAVKATNDKNEKSTLGDLDVLANLKSEMEKKDKK